MELAGYYISPAARIRVLKVLEIFGKDHLNNPELLKYRLAPILAQSAEEQQLLYNLFDQFLQDIQQQPLIHLPKTEHWWEKIPAWVLWLMGLLLVTAIFVSIIQEWLKPPVLPLKAYCEHPAEATLGDTIHIENLSAHFDTSSCKFSWAMIDKTTNLIESEKLEGEGFHWDLVIDSLGGGHEKEIRLICDNPASTERDTHLSTLRILCKDFPKVGKIIAPDKAKINESVLFKVAENQSDSLSYLWDFGEEKLDRNFEAKHAYNKSGIYTVTLKVERPNQPGFCIAEQTHQMTIGSEKAYLQAKMLHKDPLDIIMQFSLGTWILLSLLGLGVIYFWVRWFAFKKPEPAPEIAKITPEAQLQHTDRAPYFIPFRSQDSLIKVEPALYQLANVLRQRQEGLQEVLDMPHTLRKTIEGGGFPKMAFRRNTQPTDYLVLLDEYAANSHLARLYDYLIDFLVDSDVHITTFRYKTSFHRFWNKQYPDGIAMPQLQRLFPNYRLLIIGDAHEILDPFSKVKTTLKPALVQDFSFWKSRLLLTPLPQVSWTYREGTLYELFAVFSGNIAGLQLAIHFLETQNLDDESPIPDFETWKKTSTARDEHPDINYRKWRTPQDFKDYLKNYPDLYLWLCALAVFPQPTWEITLAIGKALYPKGVRVTFDHLLILARLPILQNGDWSPRLRTALLEEIDDETEQLARAAVKAELEVIAPLVKNSHANLDLQSHLAIQNFAIDPKDQENQALISLMLQQNLLNKKQVFDLNSSLQRKWSPPIQKQAPQKAMTKAAPIRPEAPDIQTFLDQEKEKEKEKTPPPVKKFTLTPDLWYALSFTFVFLVLYITAWSLDGTDFLYNIFSKNEPNTFIEDSDRVLKDYFFVKENVMIDSAVIFNNKAVDISRTRLAKMNHISEDKAAERSIKKTNDQLTEEGIEDPIPWLEKAMAYRLLPYPLAINNHLKARYNLGIEKYHDYLKTLSDNTLLNFAQQDFRSSMSPDSSNVDALHGIGLTHFYAQKMDSAGQYYKQLLGQFFFDTLSVFPNLQTFYESYLYELQQEEIRQDNAYQNNIIPTFKKPEFLLFKGKVVDTDGKEVDGVNVFFINGKTMSSGNGTYTLRLEGDFKEKGLALSFKKEGYEVLERFMVLDYRKMTLDRVSLKKIPAIKEEIKTDSTKQNDNNPPKVAEPPKTALTIFSLDKEDNSPLNGSTVRLYVLSNGEEELLSEQKNETGNKFSFSIERGKNYVLKAERQGYESTSETLTLNTTDLESGESIEKNIILFRKPSADFSSITLYFDDYNDLKSRLRPYNELFDDYSRNKELYKKKYLSKLKGEEATIAEQRFDNFFDNELQQGYNELIKFSADLFNDLRQGNHVTVTIKGYTSPKNTPSYNVELSEQYIKSVISFMSNYNKGILSQYIDSGQLKILQEAQGESSAPSYVSDNEKDERNSVYSIDAAKERRVEISAISVVQRK